MYNCVRIYEFFIASRHILRLLDLGFDCLYMRELQDKEEDKEELDLGPDEPDPPLPLTVTSRVCHRLNCKKDLFFLLRLLKRRI